MIAKGLWIASAVLALGLTAPAWAEVDLASAASCMTTRIDTGENPAQCIDEAHAACQATPQDSPAIAILCYRTAQAAWDAGIRTEMARINDRADDRIAAIAAVELKYDLIASLTQCDRMEELALVGSDISSETIQRQKARCQASSAGLAFLRVTLRGRSIK
jgi:hypothetical protein